MKIPLENVSSIPVLTLSPSGPSSHSEIDKRRYSMGSAPTSPALGRKNALNKPTSNLTSQQMMSSSLTDFDRMAVDAEYDETDSGPISMPSFAKKPSYFQRFSRTRLSQRSDSDSSGPQRQICMDCKEMVLQVVRAQSTARRLQFAKSLFQQQLLTKV